MGLGGFSFMNLASVSRDLARRGEMPLGGASLYSNEEAVMMVNAVYAIVSCDLVGDEKHQERLW